MCPAIDGNPDNIVCRVESRSREHSLQLIADIAFELGIRSLQQFLAARAILIAHGQSRMAGRAQHEEYSWLLRLAGKFVGTEAHGEIQRGIGEVRTGRNNLVNTELGETCPIANHYVRIDQRRFHQIGECLFLRIRQFWAEVRNHHVVAGQHTVIPFRYELLSVANVGNLHLFCGRAPVRAGVLNIYDCAVQAQAYRVFRAVQPAVIRFGGYHIFHRASRNAAGNQRAHQQARDRRISIGKMKNVRFRLFARRQAQSTETGVGERMIVVALFIAGQGRHRFNSHREQVVRERLEERQRLRRHAAVFRQELGITGFSQVGDLLFLRAPLQIIDLLGVHTNDVLARGPAQRRFRQKLRPRRGIHPGQQAIFSKGLLVEKCGGSQLRIQFLIVGLIENVRVDSQFFQKPLRFRAVFAGAFDRLRTSVAQQRATGDGEFVAPGVAAEVVVIVEQKNVDVAAGFLPKSISSGQPTDSCTDDDQVVGFSRINRLAHDIRTLSVSQFVGVGIGAVIVATQSHLRGRVGLLDFSCSRLVENCRGQQMLCAEACTQHAGSSAHSHSIQEIAPGDFARHSQVAVYFLFVHSSPSKVYKARSIARESDLYTILVGLRSAIPAPHANQLIRHLCRHASYGILLKRTKRMIRGD